MFPPVASATTITCVAPIALDSWVLSCMGSDGVTGLVNRGVSGSVHISCCEPKHYSPQKVRGHYVVLCDTRGSGLETYRTLCCS